MYVCIRVCLSMCMCGGRRWWGGVAVYVSVRAFVCAVVRVCN